jgi:membrane-associated phospholipid phosphatase
LKKMFSRSSPLPYDPWHTGFMKIRHFPAFPSGHTAMSLFLYLSLAILAAQAWPAYGTYFIGTALVTAGLIGAGKMYLGAHWLSDVVVGYSLGLVYTFVWMRL